MPINEKDESRLYGYQSKTRTKQTYTKVEIRKALQAAARGTQGTLSREAYQKYYEKTPGVPHSYTVIRRYGRWSLATKDAGLTSVKRGPYKTRISEDNCVDAILDARKTLGHLPSTGEYEELWHSSLKAEGHPSVSTIRSKFKRWRTAVTEASRYVDRGRCEDCGEPAVSEAHAWCEPCAAKHLEM